MHVIHCYFLFQSLVNSPSAKVGLPNFLQNLRNQTELLQNDSSSANLAAIVTILYNISSIPVEAKQSTISVRFYLMLVNTHQRLWSPLS